MFDKLKKKFKKKKFAGIGLLIISTLIIFPFEDLLVMSWIGYQNFLWLNFIFLLLLFLNGSWKFSIDLSQLKSQVTSPKVFFAGIISIVSWTYLMPFISNLLVNYHIISQSIPEMPRLFFAGSLGYIFSEMLRT